MFWAIQTAYPKLSPKLTMNEALLFRSNGGLAEQWSSCVNGFQHLYFHGAPDLVLKRKIVVVSSNEEEEEEGAEADTSTSSCDGIANQRPPMVMALGCSLSPEKVGELLAAMITRAACKIMKHICTKQAITHIYTVHGVLLDKLSGAFHCKLEICPIHITNATRGKKFSLINYKGFSDGLSHSEFIIPPLEKATKQGAMPLIRLSPIPL